GDTDALQDVNLKPAEPSCGIKPADVMVGPHRDVHGIAENDEKHVPAQALEQRRREFKVGVPPPHACQGEGNDGKDEKRRRRESAKEQPKVKKHTLAVVRTQQDIERMPLNHQYDSQDTREVYRKLPGLLHLALIHRVRGWL